MRKTECDELFAKDSRTSLANATYLYNAIPSKDGASVLSSDFWAVTNVYTAPAIIEIGESIAGTRGGEQYRSLAIEMNHRYSTNDYSPMEVEAVGDAPMESLSKQTRP